MFAWDNEDVLPVSLVWRSSGVVPGPVRLIPADDPADPRN